MNNYDIQLAPTLSGHWYSVHKIFANSRRRFLGHYPSSTTILLAFPQSAQLTQWIAEKGWSESQRIRDKAGEMGTAIHAACDSLEDGVTLDDSQYSLEEWQKINAFVEWHKKTQPKTLIKELPVFSQKYKYAGRADRVYQIDSEIVLVDFKSSRNMHNHYSLQIASYAQAIEEMTDLRIDKTAILHLGAKNKDKYRFIPYEDWKMHLKRFLSVYDVWKYDNGYDKTKEPSILDLPKSLKL